MEQKPPLALFLSIDDISKVLTGLMKLPYEQVVGLINNIQAQVSQQLTPQNSSTEQEQALVEPVTSSVSEGGEISRSRASRVKH